ncbi:MAG: EscU/YscU/HrcU family type III secretion system export apparatus switch protein [Bryobacterales bacterium]
MAEDQAQRTEQPTPRRKNKAREEGQVASSRELTASLQFGAVVGLLAMSGAMIVEGLMRAMRGTFQLAFREHVGPAELGGLARTLVEGPLSFLAPLGLLLLAIGLLSHVTQTGFALSAKKLQPDLKRLSPMQKLQELPGENLAQTAKALVLLPVAAVIFWVVLSGELERFLLLPLTSARAGAAVVANATLELLLKAAVVLAAAGGLDFYRQRRKLGKKLMMTKHEVRQEHKDIEGNPQIKARLRRLQREMMRRRMMSEVPKASVVVANPTHYAVALRYEPQKHAAPNVVAKGADHLALRIRAVADEHGVPIVENPPLAQALYRGAEIGDEIPADLYRAVAELLALIYRLRGEHPG